MFRWLLRIYPKVPIYHMIHPMWRHCGGLIHGWIVLQTTFLGYTPRCLFITWFIQYDTVVVVIIHGWIMLQTTFLGYAPRCLFITWFIQYDTVAAVIIHGWIMLQTTFLGYTLRCLFITWFIQYDTVVAVIIHGWIMLQTKGKCRAGHCPVKWLRQASMVENYECNFTPFGCAMHYGVKIVS
jgi:hypothetical protein